MTEEATVATVQQRYAAEEALDRQDALRLVELRDKALDVGLSAEEQVERMVLEQARDDREPRLQRLRREAILAQGDVDIEPVVASWEGLRAQKDAAYAEVQRAIGHLYEAWRGVFAIHLEQEQHWATLPREGSSLSSFPGGPELAQWLTSRMPQGWHGLLTSVEQQAWRIDWESVLDVDVGLKPLHSTTVGRIQDRAHAYRLKMTQQVENTPDEEEEE